MPDDIEDIYDERDAAIARVDELENIVAEQQAKLDAVCEEHGHLPRVRGGDWPEDNVCPRCGDLETGLIEHAPEVVALTMTRADAAIAREALAHEATSTEWSDSDREGMERVIARIEAFGIRGCL